MHACMDPIETKQPNVELIAKLETEIALVKLSGCAGIAERMSLTLRLRMWMTSALANCLWMESLR